MKRHLLIALAALAVTASPALASPAHPTLSEIEAQAMCVTCNIPLAVAESPQADQEKQFIQSLIDQGKTTAEIKRALVATYGSGVLALPPAHGFALAVYIVPIAVVAALLAAVALLLPRWRRNRRAQPPAAAGPGISAADSARLDADLARFDA